MTTTSLAPASSVAAAASPGCTAAAHPPGEEIVAFSAAGRTGRYLEMIPSIAEGGTPLPVVIDLHGYSETIEIHRLLSDLPTTGERHGFVVVAPQIDNPVPRWDTAVDSADVQFVLAVLDEVEANSCIDRNRVYVAGMSNGAFMTSTVACVAADRIAAAAPVAGIRDPEGCSFSRPVPVIAFHGTADTYVSYDGGLGPSVADLPTDDGGTLGTGAVSSGGPSIDDIAGAWAGRNECTPDGAVMAMTAERVADDVTLLQFACPPGSEVQLYRVEGGGHAWPGSGFSQSIESIVGPTTMSIVANELIWSFFVDHPLRGQD